MGNDLTMKEQNALVETNVPLGFDDDDADDLIIPRVKVIQTLSPERKEKIAEEGDILNSLTKERLNGKVFIPVFKFNNNVWWKPRSEGGGILCMAKDAKVGTRSTEEVIMCAACRKCEFDNTKTGKDALPTCTKYINFFGFFEGERSPIILSFSKTCYNEGKKLYSLAKVSMQNMWNFGYVLSNKLMAKGGNEWYVPVMTANGPTSEADREFALSLFKAYRNDIQNLSYDMDDTSSEVSSGPAVNTDAVEY